MKYWLDIALAALAGIIIGIVSHRMLKPTKRELLEAFMMEDDETKQEVFEALLQDMAPKQWETIPKHTINLEKLDLLYLLQQHYEENGIS